MRVLVADGHPLMRLGIRQSFESDDAFEVVGEAGTATEAVARTRRTNPDVVLLAATLSGMDLLTCLARIGDACPETKVIVLAEESTQLVRTACARGATGVIFKTIEPTDLASVIRQILQQTVYIPVGGFLDLENPGAAAGLNTREQEILAALGDGLSNPQIAARLQVTEQTVKFHLSKIYRKLDLGNRIGAARWAHQHGLQAPPPDQTPAPEHAPAPIKSGA